MTCGLVLYSVFFSSLSPVGLHGPTLFGLFGTVSEALLDPVLLDSLYVPLLHGSVLIPSLDPTETSMVGSVAAFPPCPVSNS